MSIPAPQPFSSQVFERLVTEIVNGRYSAGSRLPAERTLAVTVGASRATLREAVRRLEQCGLVTPYRGSGLLVRDRREWRLDVLPAYLKLGAISLGPERLAALLDDLLALRRTLLCDVVRLVNQRLVPGSLTPARAALERAWEARADATRYLPWDLDVVRCILEAADQMPAMWLLNSLAGVYAELAQVLRGALTLPDNYRRAYAAVFRALERGRAEDAARAMMTYLAGHDRRLLSTLGIRPARRARRAR